MENLVSEFERLHQNFPFLLGLGKNFIAALIILITGFIVSKWIRNRIRKSSIGGTHLDATLKPVVASVIYYLILALTLYAVLIKLGVPPTSLIAVFGGAAIAIALALKDTLANIASGLMLLFLRPLSVGEYVDLGSSAGTVTEVGLFSTTLKTADGIFQFVPNSTVWNTRIQNFGRHQIRRFTLSVGVGYDTDLRAAQKIILDVLETADHITTDAPSPPEAFVMSFGDNAIQYECRVWLPADVWLQRSSELRIQIKEALDNAQIEIPFPQRVVKVLREQ
jgi:small conductance mechanosensitive channel